MDGKKFFLKQIAPMVLPHFKPGEEKIIRIINDIELKDGEKEVVTILQIINNEIYAMLFAVNENFELLRQIEFKGKKSFKIIELLTKGLTSL